MGKKCSKDPNIKTWKKQAGLGPQTLTVGKESGHGYLEKKRLECGACKIPKLTFRTGNEWGKSYQGKKKLRKKRGDVGHVGTVE